MEYIKKISIIGLIVLGLGMTCQAANVRIKITKKYLNFPISHRMDRKVMSMTVGKNQVCKFVIRLAKDKPDYWVFQDMSQYKGKTITLDYEGDAEALTKIYQDNTFNGEDNIYNESQRPQFHFTTKRGWINDPNGLVWNNGTFNMFYQHNPYERDWENMHWGHAVSTDLIHWKELPDALHPDTIGTMFSGTAVIDYNNTAGFNKKGKPAMVAFYTADKPQYERQCMAYSTDDGLTFTKYSGNPIIDSHEKWQSRDTRDPKVFWYAPKNVWVMVLNERSGHSIYNSKDLKNWEFKSHLTGFWECPEMFPLPVDGNKNNIKWVLWGASGTYMTGDFDGEKFTPDGPKHSNLNGSAYAAQTFNNVPESDGRIIKIAWGRISFDDMPFNGCMLLPQEQTLRTTPEGVRLFSYPIKETESIFTPAYKGSNMSMDEANKIMEGFKDNDVLRIKATIELTYSTDAGLRYRGQRLINYDMNGNRLNNEFYVPTTPGSMLLNVDLYVDKQIIEAYVDGGAFSYSFKRDLNRDNKEGYKFYGNQIKLKDLEVYKANSIWK